MAKSRLKREPRALDYVDDAGRHVNFWYPPLWTVALWGDGAQYVYYGATSSPSGCYWMVPGTYDERAP